MAEDDWAKLAGRYREAERMTGTPASMLIDVVFTLLGNEEDSKPREVLDLACGLGIASSTALERAPWPVTVDATDLSPEMVKKTQERLSGRVRRTFVADAQSLPVEIDGAYDAVVSNFGIFLVPDVKLAAEGAARAIRPGGVCAATLWVDVDWFVTLMHAVVAALHDTTAESKMEKVLAGMTQMFDVERVCEAFRDAGLVNVKARIARTAGIIPSARRFVEIVTTFPFSKHIFATVDQPGPARDKFLDEAAAAFERISGHESPLVSNREFAIVSGTKPTD